MGSLMARIGDQPKPDLDQDPDMGPVTRDPNRDTDMLTDKEQGNKDTDTDKEHDTAARAKAELLCLS